MQAKAYPTSVGLVFSYPRQTWQPRTFYAGPMIMRYGVAMFGVLSTFNICWHITGKVRIFFLTLKSAYVE